MSDEEDAVVSFRPCSCSDRHLSPPETDPLFLAVHNGDLLRLKSLLKDVNTRNRRGCPLITYSIQHRRVEIFDYLLRTEDIDVDAVDGSGQSPLLAAFGLFDEYFTLELIKKGADVHVRDDKGFTLLHLGAWKTSEDTSRIGMVLIEAGVDLDALNHYGETALYVACHAGNLQWTHMLLYYGADPVLASDLGILPVVALADFLPHLFDYTFDEQVKVDVRLPTLVQAMKRTDSLFDRILSSTADVTYDYSDLKFLDKHLITLQARHFRTFVRKFGHVVQELVVNFSPLSRLVEFGAVTKNSEQKGIIQAILDSDYVSDFVRNSDVSYPTVAKLVQMFNKPEEEEEVTKIACVLLSYGLEVTSFDLDVVYSYFGFCDLFRILLHMNVAVVVKDKCVMSALYYDFDEDVEVLLDRMLLSPLIFVYYNHPKLKKRCSTDATNKDIAAKVKMLPSVPILVELSRNASRKYIVSRYSVKSSVQFYTVLNGLPIDKTTKSILMLERQLY